MLEEVKFIKQSPASRALHNSPSVSRKPRVLCARIPNQSQVLRLVQSQGLVHMATRVDKGTLGSLLRHREYVLLITQLLSTSPVEQKDKTSIFYFCWWWTGTNSQSSTSKALTWIRCKLGKQYLVKKFTLPWESNPGPFSNPGRCGNPSSVCWVKKNLWPFATKSK